MLAFSGSQTLTGTATIAFDGAGTARLRCNSGSVSILVTSIADINGDGFLNSQDFFDFLTMFFQNQEDFNHDGSTNSQDFFDFLQAFFGG